MGYDIGESKGPPAVDVTTRLIAKLGRELHESVTGQTSTVD